MLGLAILAGAAIYITFWAYVVHVLKNRWVQGTAVLIALAIPFGDLPFAYAAFKNHCDTEGGLHVLARVSPQTKAFFDSVPPYPIKDLFARGFRVIETRNETGKGILRFRLGQNGTLETATVAEPESDVLVTSRRGSQLPWNITRNDRYLLTRGQRTELARYSEFAWHGGWLQTALSPLLGPGPTCQASRDDPIVRLILSGGGPS